MKSLHHAYEAHPCFQEFVAHGAEPWQARYLTARLTQYFKEDLPRILNAFWERGWTSEEIWNLDRSDRTWRRNPAAFFETENVLVAAGCSVPLARHVLSSPILLETTDPAKICLAIPAFRKCGFDDSAIAYIIHNNARACLQDPQRIAAWHAYTTANNLHPLTNWRFLMTKKGVGKASDHADRRYTLDVSQFAQEPAPHLPTPSASPSIPEEPSDEHSSPDDGHDSRIEPEGVKPWSTEDAAAEERPSDVVLRRETEDAVEDAAPDSGTRVQDEPTTSQSSPPVPPTDVCAAPPDVAIPGPPALPGNLRTAKSPSLPPLVLFNPAAHQERTPTSVENPIEERVMAPHPLPHDAGYREPLPPPYVPDEITRDWSTLAHDILMQVVPGWSPGKWRAWVKKNPWIAEAHCTEITNLDQLLSWVPFSGPTVPNDNRARLIASDLLDRNLNATPRQRKRAKSNGKNAINGKRHSLAELLRMPEEVVYFRFYVLRSIVIKREPLKHPDALAYPFEQVEKYTEPLPRNFSVPPPPMTDERMWQAKAAELRWRVDEIKRRQYDASRKPFVLMLTAPTRAKFLKRLNRYEADHGRIETIVTRVNKSIVTPFSPLA